MLRVVVDNSAGGDPDLARDIASGLGTRGFDVEVREPAAGTTFDTAVHTLGAGIVLRLPERPGAEALAAVQEVVRDALMRRPSVRRRSRAIPVHVDGLPRPIDWIDVFG
jgi:hypothetical protein